MEEFSPWEIEPVDENDDNIQRESQFGALLPKLSGAASRPICLFP
jgi:hypothetical protein